MSAAGPISARPLKAAAFVPALGSTTSVSNSSPRWVLWLTGLASMLVSLDTFVVTAALPTIQADLHVSGQVLEWTVTAYTLSFAVLLMTGAALGDRFGRRRMFCAGVAVFAAASIGCALSGDIGWLIAARAVQGVGAALVMPLALALLTVAFGPSERPKALGIYASIMAVAVALGPLAGGAVVHGLGWPWIFWLNVPIALVLIVLAWVHIPASAGSGARFDAGGVLLVTAAALGIVWGLVRANAAGWTSGETLGALTGGALSASAFVTWERRAVGPMMPMRLFRVRRFVLGTAAMYLMWASTLASIYFLAQYLQHGHGYGPLGTGVRMLPWGVAPIFVGQAVGRLIPRFGERVFVVFGMALYAAGTFCLAALAEPDLAYWKIGVLLAVTGVGVAMATVGIQSAALTAVPPPDLGNASGTFSTMRQLGGTFGVAVAVAAFSARGSYASRTAFVDGFSGAMIVAGVLAVLAALIGLGLPHRRSSVRPATEPSSGPPALVCPASSSVSSFPSSPSAALSTR